MAQVETPQSQFGLWSRHAGLSALPLAAFLAGTLTLDAVLFLATPNSPRTSAIAVPVQPEPVRSTDHALPPPDHSNVFRDHRSLLAVASREETALPAVPGKAAPGAGPAIRLIEYSRDGQATLPLGIRTSSALPSGAYAVVGGVPHAAVLSHGIVAEPGTWLVDAAELGSLGLRLRPGATETSRLEVTIMGRDVRDVERQTIEIRAKPLTVVESIEIPPPPFMLAVSAPVIEPDIMEPKPSAAAGASAPMLAAVAGLTVRLPRDVKFVSGQDTKVVIGLEPAALPPAGAYVILRGGAPGTVVSSGLSIGPEIWLLSLTELESLTLRVPSGVAGPLALSAQLVSVDGRLLAEDRVALAVEGAPSPQPPQSRPAAPVLTAPVRVAATTAAPRVPAPLASDASRLGGPSVPIARAVTPRAPIAKEVPAKAVAAPAAKTSQTTLSRGRKMLALGYIAGARPLLERAAAEGSAEAASLLGASFDPDWLRNNKTLGITGDVAAARKWYEEARRLGAPDADKLISALGTGQ